MTVNQIHHATPRPFFSQVRTQSLRAALFVFVSQFAIFGCGDSNDADDSHPSDSAPPATGPTDYSEGGSFRAGFRSMSAPASDLAIKVWYPTLDEGENAIEYEVEFKADYFGSETGTILGQALRDAALAPTDAPFPVVVFSHGFSFNPEWYSDLMEHLASRGFVVLAPEHEEGDWHATVVDATFDRPAAVQRTIDLAEAMNRDEAFRRSLDLKRLAVVGHSYGGYTALAAAGARFDVEGLKKRCSGLDAADPKTFLCHPFVSDERALERLEVASQGSNSPLADSRVRAIVTIAGDAYMFGEEGLASVSVPTLAVGGTGDNWSPWAWGAELTYSSVGSDQIALAGLEGADHMIAVNTCDDLPWTDALTDELSFVLCQDPVWDRAKALTVVRGLVTAFLLDTLADDSEARDALSNDAVKEADLQFASSW